LFVGARWVVRESPRFTRTVVARELVRVPAGVFPAWRLMGTAEAFGPEDRLDVWYSSAGLVRLRFHVVGDAVGDQGNVSGRAVTDSDQTLTAIELTGAARVLASVSGEPPGAE